MPQHLRRLFLWLGSGLLIGCSASASPAEERWYSIEIGGERAGFLVERVSRGDGVLTTESEMEIRLSRGSSALVLALDSRFVESLEGQPVEMWSRQQMGQVPIEISVRFGPSGAHQRTVQAGSVTEQDLPAPEGPWLPPGAAQIVLGKHLAGSAETFSIRTVDPLLGPRSFDLAYTRLGPPVEVALPGGKMLATPFRQVSRAEGSVEATVYLDEQGRTVQSEAALLGFAMVTRLTSEADARSGHGAPELLVRSFVRPERPLASPRSLRKGVYRLTLDHGELPPIPETAAQTVVRDGSGARVTVVGSANSQSLPGDFVSEPFLRASAYLNYQDPRVERLRSQALDQVPEARAERAERLRSFVHQRLRSKDLATGFATASEVAARLSGDCTEHAVLLAALLRGDGIASRVVAGLLYVEEFAGVREIFGYHMWTQAWLDGRWVDLDAMLERPFDAAHIALATSDLNDSEALLATSSQLLQVMGRLRIEVLSAEP